MSDYNPTDGRASAASRRAKKLARRQRLDELAKQRVLKSLLQHPDGRVFLWGLLASCGVYQSSYTGDNATFFREGRRAVGLQLLEEIHNVDPSGYATMIVENREKDDAPNEDPEDADDTGSE